MRTLSSGAQLTEDEQRIDGPRLDPDSGRAYLDPPAIPDPASRSIGPPVTSSPPNLAEPYRTRPVRFLGLVRLDGWRVKTYGISARSERPPDVLIRAAERLARERLPEPPVRSWGGGEQADVATDRYGVAIVIVHEAREGSFVLVSWWVGENMLAHHAHFAPDGPPYAFESLADRGIVACVWELAVLSFERRAWIETVLARPGGPDLEAYLARRMNADV